MVKHNNIIPNQHFHKKWQTSSRGPLHIVSWFDQPGKKKARRLKRAAKAGAIAPRPLARLRPLVHCPTQMHNAKVRLGRGFSLAELKGAEISPLVAKTIGVAVDHRRVNTSQESLKLNVQRLLDYKAKLVTFPMKGSDVRDAMQNLDKKLMMDAKQSTKMELVDVTDELKATMVYSDLRTTRNKKSLAGIREKMAKEKETKK